MMERRVFLKNTAMSLAAAAASGGSSSALAADASGTEWKKAPCLLKRHPAE